MATRRGQFKIVSCIACGEKRKMPLDGGHVNPDVIKRFESTGWLYKAFSKGFCEKCNLLGDILKEVVSEPVAV